MIDGKSEHRWFYYPLHELTERFTWEDVYLLPDIESWKKDSIWLTIVALDAMRDNYGPEAMHEIETLMGTADHYFEHEAIQLYVRRDHLTFDTMLEWISVALNDLGYRCDELVRGTPKQFANSNAHSRFMGNIIDAYESTQSKR